MQIVPLGQIELGRQIVDLLPRMRRFALVLTRSPDMADDLVQSSAARALERTAQWEDGTRLDHWLFRIIKTVWLNGRKAARLRQTECLDDHADSSATDGSAAMEAHMTLNEVRAAFARLPEDQQRALFLVSVEGYSYRQAAELLDVPLGTVISRLARGRVALAQRTTDNTDRIVVLRRNRS